MMSTKCQRAELDIAAVRREPPRAAPSTAARAGCRCRRSWGACRSSRSTGRRKSAPGSAGFACRKFPMELRRREYLDVLGVYSIAFTPRNVAPSTMVAIRNQPRRFRSIERHGRQAPWRAADQHHGVERSQSDVEVVGEGVREHVPEDVGGEQAAENSTLSTNSHIPSDVARPLLSRYRSGAPARAGCVSAHACGAKSPVWSVLDKLGLLGGEGVDLLVGRTHHQTTGVREVLRRRRAGLPQADSAQGFSCLAVASTRRGRSAAA